MIDQRTAHAALPLPHPNNELQQDVLRLRQALELIDTRLANLDHKLQSDDTALDEWQELTQALQQQRASTQQTRAEFAQARLERLLGLAL